MSELTLADIRRSIEGGIPVVIATADADGEPNITYLSVIQQVDDERVALSNQFMSKTARNLAVNPRAALLALDPVTCSEYRLHLVFERTERRGPVFERLRKEVDEHAAMVGMQEVFRLRTADIYRVERIDAVVEVEVDGVASGADGQHPPIDLARLGQFVQRLSRCADLDGMVDAVVRGLDELLGYSHSMVLLVDETGERLFTIASHGFATEGVGSEMAIGEGTAGAAAQRAEPVRVGDLGQMQKYAESVRRSYEGVHGQGAVDIAVPTSRRTRSRLAVPAVSRGQVVGVVVVESALPTAFDEDDEQAVAVVASLLAGMIELDQEPAATAPQAPGAPAVPAPPVTDAVDVRFFASDGSVFLGNDYLIRGVAGRVLWSILQRHERTGEADFTLKELRLDKSLELPGFRDNLDTRVILLKRRLEERDAPVRLHRSGRGRFTLELRAPIALVHHE